MDRNTMTHEQKIAWQLAIIAEDAAQEDAIAAKKAWQAARDSVDKRARDEAAAHMERAVEVWELAKSHLRAYPRGIPRWS